MANKVEIVITAVDHATGTIKDVGRTLGGLGKVVGAGLVAGLGVAVAGVGALTAGLMSSVKEAMEAQENIAQLNAVLASTGGKAGITEKAALDLADALQKVTRYADDEILSAENMLLTFTNIGKDIFPDTTKAVLNLSTAMKQDLKSSAVQIGKALNDPVKGITALQRVGVAFTDKQKDLVEFLVKDNQLLAAQTIILKELETEFGGAAEAAGKTFAGQMDILRHSFEDLKEGIGAAFLPFLERVVGSLGGLMDNPWIQALPGKIKSWVNSSLIPAFDTFTAWVQNEFIPTINDMFNGEGGIWGWLQRAAADAPFKLSEITAAIHLWANSEETQAKIAESGEKLGMYVANGIANAFTDGTATHEAMEGVYKGLKNLDKEAKTEFSNIAGVWVENFISGFYKRITGKEMSERWGRIIADGMKQAMMSAFSYMDISSWWNMALNAVMGWVKLIPEFINQTLNKINTGYFQQYNNPGTSSYYSYQGAIGGGYLPPSYGTAAWYSLNGVFANGGNFTVPQGYPNDSYRIGLTSGETVSVTPAGKSSAQTVIVNYQPTFSLADRAEFTNKLMPLLRDALRAV